MKLTEHFDDFLSDTVNLDKTRLTRLESSVEALETFIRDSNWGPSVRRFVPQGSWAHQTIIRPVEKKAFDADLLAFVNPKDGWEAKTYVDELYNAFKGSKLYQDKVQRYSHCVTIEYAEERKIDIAPCVINRDGIERGEVCNRISNEFERSEPEKYTDWLVERNSWTGRNYLRKVTRLIKYLRDIKGTFSCPSVLLTTLLGARITWADEENTSDFADLPTSLKTIFARLDDWLQAHPTKPTVTNPTLGTETFSEMWDEDLKYTNFRAKINKYRKWIDAAYDEFDRDESIGKWRRVFGENFAKGVTVEKAAKVSDTAVAFLRHARTDGVLATGDDLVSLFSRFGRNALPPNFDRLPHKQRPWWKELPRPLFAVGIAATQHATRGGESLGPVSEHVPLPKRHWLQFRAYAKDGTPLSLDFDVYWRVTNTDQAAHAANSLRGEIITCPSFYRWEQLAYRGVHSVEAFIVRTRDDVLVAQSEPFYVPIR